jgi:hypothetical protein
VEEKRLETKYFLSRIYKLELNSKATRLIPILTILFFRTYTQGRSGHWGNCREPFFFENARLFFKNAWHFKDIFREFEDF